jgi:hypothetical protein
VRSISGKPGIASGSPHLLTKPIVRAAHDHARIVAAWHARKSCLRHPAGHILHIAWINGRSLDADDGIIGIRPWEWPVCYVKLRRVAELFELDYLHDCSPWSKSMSVLDTQEAIFAVAVLAFSDRRKCTRPANYPAKY